MHVSFRKSCPAGWLAGWLSRWPVVVVWLDLSLAAGARRLSSCKIYGLGESVPAARWKCWESGGAGNWPSGCCGGANLPQQRSIYRNRRQRSEPVLFSCYGWVACCVALFSILCACLCLCVCWCRPALGSRVPCWLWLCVSPCSSLRFSRLQVSGAAWFCICFLFSILCIYVPSAQQFSLLNYGCFRRKRWCR